MSHLKQNKILYDVGIFGIVMNVYYICHYEGDHDVDDNGLMRFMRVDIDGDDNRCYEVYKLSYPVAVEVARYCVTVQQDG